MILRRLQIGANKKLRQITTAKQNETPAVKERDGN